MKKVQFLAIMLFFVICSCTNNSPRPVAENFLNAMSERNYEEARKYATKETQKLLNQLEKIEEIAGVSDDFKPGKITITLEEIKGNTAIVYFKEEGNPLDQKVTLKKENGDSNSSEWKVAMRKEEIKLNRSFGGEQEQSNKIPS